MVTLEGSLRSLTTAPSSLALTELEIAHELWNLLIPLDPDSTFSSAHLGWWQEFLVQRGSKAVSKDTWNLVRRLCAAARSALTNNHSSL